MEFIQQFALVNQITLPSGPGSPPSIGHSYPISASYGSGPLPSGVGTQLASCQDCQGLDFGDVQGDNDALVAGIIHAQVPGFYVFSAPWETTIAMLESIKRTEGYDLSLPQAYEGGNLVYAISISPSVGARFLTYDSRLSPPSTYPVLPTPVSSAPCVGQAPFTITRTGGK